MDLKIYDLELATPRESTITIDQVIGYCSGVEPGYLAEPILCLANILKEQQKEIKCLKQKLKRLEGLDSK